MAQQKESIKAQFVRLQSLLSSQTKTEATLQYLQQLLVFFREADLKNEAVMKHEVYDELRDTVKSIFSYLQKVKVPDSSISRAIEQRIKEFLIAISHFCSSFYCVYYPLGCGDMIREFLASECRLFVPSFALPNRSSDHLSQQIQKTAPTKDERMEQIKEQNLEQIKQERSWVWAKQSSFKTNFFCDCIETIMKNLSSFQAYFSDMRIPVISQYLRLLYYMDDYVIQDKIIALCLSHAEALEKLFLNPSKEIMKDANKQKLEEISQYLTKMLRHYKNDSVKKTIQLLGPILGITMMKMNSIEKKIMGSKIVSKFSYEMLYRSTSFISETSFAEWIFQQNFFDLVFQDHCQVSLIKSSEDTFKLLVKKGQLPKEQFQKFFSILQKAEPELRKAMFRLIDPFRVDYYQIEAMIEIFKNIWGTQFYDDQFFYFLEGLSRYSTEKQLTTMLAIIERIIKEHYSKFQSYLTKRRSVECYSYVFERLITYKDLNERIEAYTKVAADFVEQPSQNKLIMLRTLFENLSEHKMEKSYQQILCDKIIINLQFIEKSLKYGSEIKFRDDLISTIKIILKKYGYSFNKQPFSQETLLQTVEFPQIFEEMLTLIKENNEKNLESLFNQLADLSALKSFPFSCIKCVYTKLNWKTLRPIKKEYTDFVGTYVTYCNPQTFIGIDTLKYLIFNSSKPSVRQGACQLLVETYTNLADDFREEGEFYLIQFMKNMAKLIHYKLKGFFEGTQSVISVLGALELTEDLMLNTEYFGVGSLQAHNSLIPTSTVTLKVYNNCTYGDDVLKIFEKKLPSNKTLFDVIIEVSKQFKIGPLDMCFQYPNSSTIKHNGLTLEELKLNKQEVNAIKLPQSRLKKDALLIDGKLSPKAVKVFTDIFNKFAINGKMTSKECASYIEGVTLSFCPIFDPRINSLYADYDKDKDGVLTLQDFLKFYQDCAIDPEKLETVDKNLSNMRYRRDLKFFDEDLDSMNEEVLFRYHICQNQDIYQCLFKLSHHDDLQISFLSKLLLLRLPTYSKVADSLTESINLKEKNPFEVEYLLTALQYQIAHEQAFSQKLLNSQNHLAIFQYLSQLCSKQQKRSENQKNCLIICLHLLHSLIGLKKSSDVRPKQFPKLAFTLPKTDVFINIIRESLISNDSALLEPAYSLELTQKEMPFDWISEAAFNRDKDIRTITCGFLYLWLLKNKNADLNIFSIKILNENNEQWFNLLTIVINVGIQIDYKDIFITKLEELKGCREELQGNRFNPVIQGNLNIIKELYCRLSQEEIQLLSKTLSQTLPSLISNENRELVYQMNLKNDPELLLGTLEEIVNIKVGKQAQPRNKFVGIKNLGCICYMNSILQQFFMIKSFHSLIMSLESKKEESEVSNVKIVDDFLYQLKKMYIHLELSQKQYYDPTTFCLAIKDPQGKPINTSVQEDAHEFLNTVFDKIESYAKEQKKVKILQRIFGGKTVTEIICQTCKNKNEVLEHYYHLTLEVKGMKTLKDSFDKLIVPEEIADYFCVNCDRKVEKITKQTLLKQTPEILIINLQRIVFDLESFLKVKVHTKLQFQHVLDLHNYCSSSTHPAQFNLKGVVIHSGTSEGGHYYSLIKQDGKWYKFNDQSVTAFNQIDIGREAFGGDESSDTLGDLTSSTNAYILFYEKAHQSEDQEGEELKQVDSENLRQIVLAENKQFQHQLQLYQPSYFNCLHSLLQLYKKDQKMIGLEKLFSIHLKLLEHLGTNADLKTQTLNQIKDDFLLLCSCLPDKVTHILEKFNSKTFGQTICTSNDVNIREIYQKILAKAILSIIPSQGEFPQKALDFINDMLGLLDDDLLLKNIYKSYQYFDIWKELVVNQRIKEVMLKRDCLGKFLDLLMGSESAKSSKQKKRQDLSISQAMPLIPVILELLQSKLNLVGQRLDRDPSLEYYQLTQDERKILNNSNFYKKMMRTKLDMGLLAPIISLLSYKDQAYSKFIVQILIRAMNNNDDIPDKNVVFQNLKAFFLVEDEFSQDRLEWGLGIYQLDSISYSYQTDQEFGMENSSQSKVYTYASSLLFVADEKYGPLLYNLFNKRKYYNAFSVYGVIMLLELVIESPRALEHILSLPPPIYIHKSYMDWIQQFVRRIQKEEHYGLPLEKNILSSKLNTLIKEYKEKAVKTPLFDSLPLNKKIIGKNFQVILKEVLTEPDYIIEMWAHDTYFLPNRPYGMGNFELPEAEFAFSSKTESIKTKYFFKRVEFNAKKQSEPLVQHEFTVLLFNIQSKVNLILNFKVEGFMYKIYLRSGDSKIKCPYKEGDLKSIVVIERKQAEVEEVKEKSGFKQQMNEMGAAAAAVDSHLIMDFDYSSYMQVNCKECTLLNIGRQTCQACGSDLFK